MSYARFAAMIVTSTLVMFALMYVHTYTWDAALFSETRAWMAVLMGAAMAIVMLGFMTTMYKRPAVNAAIFAGAGVLVALTVWLVRSQATVSGLDYMQAMVPHHSIAILTSDRAGIRDPRVRKLADEIIESQRKEIAEMKYLIRALERDGVQSGYAITPPVEEMPAGEAARRAQLATTDLETLTNGDVQRALGTTAVCSFAYAADAAPVAAALTSGGRGVIKLHGRLVPMNVRAELPRSQGFQLAADDVTVRTVVDDGAESGGVREAEARLEIGDELAVGYGGFYRCTGD